MTYYTAKQRIEYYKNKLEVVEKENDEKLEQIGYLMKENNQLRFEIAILKNKLKIGEKNDK